MDKKNFVFFAILCAVLGCFYLFMHYQVKSAEDLISDVSVHEPPKAIVSQRQVKKPAKKIKPRPEFVEPIQVDDGFDISPEEADKVISD